MDIQLLLTTYELSSSASRRAAVEAFGLEQRTLNAGLPLTLLATLAQFGKFIALRNIFGGCNSIKGLNPTLIGNPLTYRMDVRDKRAA